MPCLHDLLGGVIKIREYQQMQGRIPGKCAKPTGDIGHLNLGEAADHAAAEPLEPSLQKRKVVDAARLPIPNDHVGALVENGLYERGNIAAVILVVAIRVDDDIRAEFEAGVKAHLEGMPQAAIFGERDDVIHAEFPRHFSRAIIRPVVNDQDLDFVNAGDRTRNILDRRGQGFFFVEAGNLDDEFHVETVGVRGWRAFAV